MDPSPPNYRGIDRLQNGALRSPGFDIDPWRQASTDTTTAAPPYALIPGVDGPLNSFQWDKTDSTPNLNPYGSSSSSSSKATQSNAVAGPSGSTQPEMIDTATDILKKAPFTDDEHEDAASPTLKEPLYGPPSYPPPTFKSKLPLHPSSTKLKGDLPPTPPPELSVSPAGPSSQYPSPTNPLSLNEFTQTMLPVSPDPTEASTDSSPFYPGQHFIPPIPARPSADVGRYSFYPDQNFPVSASDYKIIASSKNMDLYLDRGNQTTHPDYGKGETVAGYIDLKKLKNVVEMSVTLEGRIQVMFTKGGKMYEQIVLPLFTTTRVLYSSASNRPPTQGQKYLFNLQFPQTCDSRFSPLPPSWLVSETVFDRPVNQPAFFAKVEYRVRADMTAKILMGKKEYRIETPAGYYPRNCPPFPLPSSRELSTPGERLLTREIRAALPPMGRLGFEGSTAPTPFMAKIELQKPLVYISGAHIPYTVHLSSPVHTVPAALKLQVQLIKTVEVWVYGKGYLKEYIVGKGDNAEKRFIQQNIDDVPEWSPWNDPKSKGSGGATAVIEGSCQLAKEGQEMSWKINRLAYVKYSIRFTVTPTPQAAEFATFKESLPAFCHSEDIEVVTDSADAIQSDWQASRPSNRVRRSNRKKTSETIAEVVPLPQPDVATEKSGEN